MRQINLNDVISFVEENIGDFHARRADSLQSLKLTQVLKRKNPYLFKAKNINDAHDLVKIDSRCSFIFTRRNSLW